MADDTGEGRDPSPEDEKTGTQRSTHGLSSQKKKEEGRTIYLQQSPLMD